MTNPSAKELLQRYHRNGEQGLRSFSDNEIITKVLDGHTDLFKIIVRRYNQRLFRIVRGYVTNKQDAEDVIQSTYLNAFNNLEQFRGEAQFSTWLIRIGINEALKKKKGERNISDLYSVTDHQNSDQKNNEEGPTPESKVIEDDMNKHLENAIDALPAKYRSVLIMREIEQLSTKETAKVLDISRSNVKVRLHRAKKMLREKLTDMLNEIDLFSFKGEDCDRMTHQTMEMVKNSNQQNENF